ncbi:uncharacterized protein [Pseudorasbora parva]|uniref:uncharacterized protein isoform X3 n=1 Tax=Pseudorasbora parva TaxID=51549 RepID=UPI00351DE424
MRHLNAKLKRAPGQSVVTAHVMLPEPNHPTLTRSGLQTSHTAAWRAFYNEGGRTHAAHKHTNTCFCLFKGCKVWERRQGRSLRSSLPGLLSCQGRARVMKAVKSLQKCSTQQCISFWRCSRVSLCSLKPDSPQIYPFTPHLLCD